MVKVVKGQKRMTIKSIKVFAKDHLILMKMALIEGVSVAKVLSLLLKRRRQRNETNKI